MKLSGCGVGVSGVMGRVDSVAGAVGGLDTVAGVGLGAGAEKEIEVDGVVAEDGVGVKDEVGVGVAAAVELLLEVVLDGGAKVGVDPDAPKLSEDVPKLKPEAGGLKVGALAGAAGVVPVAEVVEVGVVEVAKTFVVEVLEVW
jgi:hypothetical protein